MVNSKIITVFSVDRTQGEQFLLTGEGLAVTGNCPPDAEVSFDDQTGPRVPIADLRIWSASKPFTSIWLFHTTPITSNFAKIRLYAFGLDAAPLPYSLPVTTQLGDNSSSWGGGSGQVIGNAGLGFLFNDQSGAWDRQRGTVLSTPFGTALRTTAQVSALLTNWNHRGVLFVANVSVASGTGGLTFIVEGSDEGTPTYYPILQSVPITAVGIVVLRVYPGIAAVANQAASDVIPKHIRLRVAVGDASPYTYFVTCTLLL